MESTNFDVTACPIPSHSCLRIVQSSSLFFGEYGLTRRSSSSQRCSMGFKSGDCDDQSKTLILFLAKPFTYRSSSVFGIIILLKSE